MSRNDNVTQLNMHQLIICKLHAFLQMIGAHELAGYFKKNAGFCFGLSICHGVMDQIGKLDWWEAALKEAAHWDTTVESLNKDIHLPNEVSSSTLKDLMERVVNYLVWNHADTSWDQLPFSLSQDNFLDPNTASFEVCQKTSNNNSSIHQIKTREKIAGCFTHEHLNFLLEKNILKNTLFLIHNHNHTIRIGYKNGCWLVYNPNYPPTQFYKLFPNKSCFINEILNIQGHIIGMEVASLSAIEDHNSLSKKFGTLINSDVTQARIILSIHSFSVITRHTPIYIPKIITHVLQENGAQKKIIDALTDQKESHPSLLKLMSRYAPHYLLYLFAQMKFTPEIIYKLVTYRDMFGYSCLQYFIQDKHHDIIVALLNHLFNTANNKEKLANELMEHKINGKNVFNYIANQLTKKAANNTMGIHILAKKNPTLLTSSFICASYAPYFNSDVTCSFDNQNMDGESVLSIIALHSPNYLFFLLEQIEQGKLSFGTLIPALTKKNKEGITGSDTIATHAPICMPKIEAIRNRLYQSQRHTFFYIEKSNKRRKCSMQPIDGNLHTLRYP